MLCSLWSCNDLQLCRVFGVGFSLIFGVFFSFFSPNFSICSGIPLFLSKKMRIAIREMVSFFPKISVLNL